MLRPAKMLPIPPPSATELGLWATGVVAASTAYLVTAADIFLAAATVAAAASSVRTLWAQHP